MEQKPVKFRYFGNVSRVYDYIQEQKQNFQIEYDEDLGVAFEKVEGVKREDLL